MVVNMFKSSLLICVLRFCEWTVHNLFGLFPNYWAFLALFCFLLLQMSLPQTPDLVLLLVILDYFARSNSQEGSQVKLVTVWYWLLLYCTLLHLSRIAHSRSSVKVCWMNYDLIHSWSTVLYSHVHRATSLHLPRLQIFEVSGYWLFCRRTWILNEWIFKNALFSSILKFSYIIGKWVAVTGLSALCLLEKKQ